MGDVAIARVGVHPFAAFAIVATSNGVNFTDGLDGLAGGTLIFAFVGYMIIALAAPLAQPNLATLCALIIGALLGFLWFNVHPAQIFMGDSGSLAMGATLAVMSLITGQILLLPLIGLIFVLEVGSDILQIGYYKMTPAGASSRMAPLHHHFELSGWDEEKITMRFWIVGVLAAMLGVVFFLATWTSCCEAMRSIPPAARRPSTWRRLDARLLRRPAGRRAGPGPQRHRPGPLPRRPRAPRHGLRRAPRAELRGADRSRTDRAVDLCWARTWIRGRPARPGAGLHLAVDQQPLPDDRAAPASRAGRVEAAGVVPVVSEVDLFLRLCPAPTVGVTGTKGKTTTTR